jgi:hypothetical protein
MPGLMPQNPHTFAFTGSFNFQHLCSLKLHQSRVRKIERNRKSRDAIRCEPFFAEPDMRLEGNRTRVQLPIELLHTLF